MAFCVLLPRFSRKGNGLEYPLQLHEGIWAGRGWGPPAPMPGWTGIAVETVGSNDKLKMPPWAKSASSRLDRGLGL